jgi:hypothetical protein
MQLMVSLPPSLCELRRTSRSTLPARVAERAGVVAADCVHHSRMMPCELPKRKPRKFQQDDFRTEAADFIPKPMKHRVRGWIRTIVTTIKVSGLAIGRRADTVAMRHSELADADPIAVIWITVGASGASAADAAPIADAADSRGCDRDRRAADPVFTVCALNYSRGATTCGHRCT